MVASGYFGKSSVCRDTTHYLIFVSLVIRLFPSTWAWVISSSMFEACILLWHLVINQSLVVLVLFLLSQQIFLSIG